MMHLNSSDTRNTASKPVLENLKKLIKEQYPELIPAAKKVNKQIGRAKSFDKDIYLWILFYPVRFILCRSTWLFWFVYQGAGLVKVNRKPIAFSSDKEKLMEQVLSDLKRDGYAVWPSLFSPEELRVVNQKMTDLFQRSRNLLASAPAHIDGVIDPENKGWRHTRLPIGQEFDAYKLSDFSGAYGRTRTRISSVPDDLKYISEKKEIFEIVARFFSCEVKFKRMLLEELKPAIMGDYWHVDSYGDCIKAMILTKDCEIENGPLRYKLGTHKTWAKGRRILYHLMFKFGSTFSQPPLQLNQSIPGEIVYGTGKAGDCIFFVNSGIHSGTRCISGERRTVVVGTTRKTFRNSLFRVLGPLE